MRCSIDKFADFSAASSLKRSIIPVFGSAFACKSKPTRRSVPSAKR